jgi:hypothetical protein
LFAIYWVAIAGMLLLLVSGVTQLVVAVSW